MSDAQRVLKNTLALSIANSMPRITQAVVIFVAARIIGDVGLGKYYTIASLVALTSLVTDLGINPSFTREVSTNRSQASKYFFNLFLVKILLGVLSYFSLILITILLDYPIDILQSAYLYGVYMALWAFSSLFLSLFQAFEEMRYNAWIWGSSALINLTVSIVLLKNGGNFMSPIWGLTVGAVVGFIIAFYIGKDKIEFSWSYFDKKFLKETLRATFPFALNTIFSTIYFRIDSIILSKLESEQVMGWYGAAYKLLDNLLMLPNFFLGAVYPVLCRFYKQSHERLAEIFSQSFKVMAVAAFPISIGLFLTAEKAILLLYGPDFVNGTVSLQILSFALLAIFFTSLGVMTLMAMGRMKVVNTVGAINIVLNLLLSFILIPDWGLGFSLNGAAIATLACELFGLGVFLIFFIRINLFKKEMMKAIIKPISATLTMAVVVYFTLDFNVLINIGTGLTVYVIAMLLMGAFNKHELALIKGMFKK